MSAVRKRSNFYKENSQRKRESDGLTGKVLGGTDAANRNF